MSNPKHKISKQDILNMTEDLKKIVKMMMLDDEKTKRAILTWKNG